MRAILAGSLVILAVFALADFASPPPAGRGLVVRPDDAVFRDARADDAIVLSCVSIVTTCASCGRVPSSCCEVAAWTRRPGSSGRVVSVFDRLDVTPRQELRAIDWHRDRWTLSWIDSSNHAHTILHEGNAQR